MGLAYGPAESLSNGGSLERRRIARPGPELAHERRRFPTAESVPTARNSLRRRNGAYGPEIVPNGGEHPTGERIPG
ncbi:MAG: hypothetical protein LC104_22390 [Bacteroidales bacterium]|nr:hypothetical protein [Bacteroidales bacterium]